MIWKNKFINSFEELRKKSDWEKEKKEEKKKKSMIKIVNYFKERERDLIIFPFLFLSKGGGIRDNYSNISINQSNH